MKIYGFSDEASPSIDGQIRALKRNGLNGMEIRGTDQGNVSSISVAYAKEILKKLQDHDLCVWSIGSPIGKIDIEKDDFSKHMDLLRHTLEIANAMECRNLRMFSFYIPSDKDPSLYRNEVIDRLSLMEEEGRKAGITLCHENEKGIYGSIAPRCEEILNAVPGLKSIFDPANYIQCGQDIPAAWNLLGKRTYYMHIKDALPDGSVVPAGKGIGCLKDLVREFVQNGGENVTIEPHLQVFSGLADLEKDKKTEIPLYAYESGDAAFDAAVNALKSILP